MTDNIELLKQISHTLNLHGSVQQNTQLHERIESAIESAATPPDVEQLAWMQFYKPPFRFDTESGYIFDDKGDMVVEVRGWGLLQYEDGAESLQDGMGKTIAESLNRLAGYQAGQSAVQDATPIEEMVKQWHEWQVETFPGATAISKLHHLEEEADELIKALKRGYSTEIEKEFADCFALLFGSAYITGLTMPDIVRIMGEKLEINKARKWGKPDANGVVKHVEEGSQDATPQEWEKSVKRYVMEELWGFDHIQEEAGLSERLRNELKDFVEAINHFTAALRSELSAAQAQAKALSAIKKGLETSLTEALSSLSAAQEENKRMREKREWLQRYLNENKTPPESGEQTK